MKMFSKLRVLGVLGLAVVAAQPASAALVSSNGFGNFTATNPSITIGCGAGYVACCGNTGFTAARANQFVVLGTGNVNNAGSLFTIAATATGTR